MNKVHYTFIPQNLICILWWCTKVVHLYPSTAVHTKQLILKNMPTDLQVGHDSFMRTKNWKPLSVNLGGSLSLQKWHRRVTNQPDSQPSKWTSKHVIHIKRNKQPLSQKTPLEDSHHRGAYIHHLFSLGWVYKLQKKTLFYHNWSFMKE